MIVLVLTACPSGLRGFLTRWLMEISAGVFVGKVNGKVRELLWERTVEMIGPGQAILVRSVRTEQGLDVRVHGHHWEPIDIDGITLMLRPDLAVDSAVDSSSDSTPRHSSRVPGGHGSETGKPRAGWSKAARRRRYG